MTVARVPITGVFDLDDGPVTLTVVVGERQQGYTVVTVEDEEKCDGADLRNCALGDGAQLGGRTLYSDTTVTVTNPQSLRTTVTLTVKQGSRSRDYSKSKTMSEIGDSVIYEGEIEFRQEGE